MNQPQTDIRAVLKSSGYKLTTQRLAVFNLLKNGDALTMQEIYGQIKHQSDRASLYRTIKLFEDLGIVQRINIGWKYKLELSDKFLVHHHHLSCIKCHRVETISESDLEVFINRLAERYSFKPLNHQVEIQGLCFSCSRLNNNLA